MQSKSISYTGNVLIETQDYDVCRPFLSAVKFEQHSTFTFIITTIFGFGDTEHSGTICIVIVNVIYKISPSVHLFSIVQLLVMIVYYLAINRQFQEGCICTVAI